MQESLRYSALILCTDQYGLGSAVYLPYLLFLQAKWRLLKVIDCLISKLVLKVALCHVLNHDICHWLEICIYVYMQVNKYR